MTTRSTIYTPRCSIDMLLSLTGEKNKSTCTKIPYRGFEISICMDSSHGNGDLFRSDIRIYNATDDDVSTNLLGSDMIQGTGENLFAIFKAIDQLLESLDKETLTRIQTEKEH
jgi:hypothetical protein